MNLIRRFTRIISRFHIRTLFLPFVLAIVIIPDLFIIGSVYSNMKTLGETRLHLSSSAAASAAFPVVEQIGIIALITLVVLFILVWFVCRIVFLKPMDGFIKRLNAVSGHDLSRQLEDSVVTNREFGEMRNSVNQMIGSLNGIINTIRHKSETVAASSEELTASSEENKAATDEISHSLQLVASATDKDLQSVNVAKKDNDGINMSIVAITMDTMQLAESAKESVRTARLGEKEMIRATQQMREIKETVNELAEMVGKLSTQTQDVNQIIRDINDIADQTQLLSLNASIEAARAGEQGKGFSVVADEIGKLADQSAESAQKVHEILAAIQNETERVAQSMGVGVAKVDQGMETVERTGESFKQIEDLVNETSEKMKTVDSEVNKISQVSFKAAAAYKTIETAALATSEQTLTISSASKEQAAAAEEVANSAGALAAIADELHQVVISFKVKAD